MLPPRLALGTWDDFNRFAGLWPAVEASLSQFDIRPQWFHSLARPQSWAGLGNGRRMCYLDSWSMAPERAAELLERGSGGAQLAIVVGSFASERAGKNDQTGGSLLELSRQLNMPRVLVIDAADAMSVELPASLELAGVLLAGDRGELLARATLRLQQQFNLPVVGRWTAGKVSWSPAFQATLLTARDQAEIHCQRNVFLRCRERRRWPLRIAIAYDEAFSGYFPETLATLQGAGATFLDFSPLRNDCLPNDADVVYLGDGPVGEWLSKIAANHCFLHRLFAFANRGGKIVAEGRAAVCLCREARPLSGKPIPLTGIVPATADETTTDDFLPLELRLEQNSWLARQGTLFQGYAPTQWQLTPEEPDAGFQQAGQIFVQANVLALPFAQHWASRPDLIRSFFRARGQRSPDRATV